MGMGMGHRGQQQWLLLAKVTVRVGRGSGQAMHLGTQTAAADGVLPMILDTRDTFPLLLLFNDLHLLLIFLIINFLLVDLLLSIALSTAKVLLLAAVQC